MGRPVRARSTRSRICRCPTVFAAQGAVPDRGVRDQPGLRPAARLRVGEVRTGRDRRRPDALDGRPAAARRARWPGTRPRARLHRRALRRGDARALERRQPRAAPTRASPTPRARSRATRQRPDEGPSRDQAARSGRSAPGPRAADARSGRSAARCSPPKTFRTRSIPSWRTVRARRPTRAAERRCRSPTTTARGSTTAR